MAENALKMKKNALFLRKNGNFFGKNLVNKQKSINFAAENVENELIFNLLLIE